MTAPRTTWFLRRTTMFLLMQLAHLSAACGHEKLDESLFVSHRTLGNELEIEEVYACGMPPPTEEQKRMLGQAHIEWNRNNKHRDLSVMSFDVPVYWHVLQYNETLGALKRSTIVDGYMPILNRAFNATPFRFILQGMDHVINEEYFNCTNTQNLQRIMRQGGSNALNIYVCNTYSTGLAGWAYLPAIVKVSPLHLDSVFVMNADVSRAYLSNYYTLVHEVSHWLGLFHTFEGGCSSDLISSYGGLYYMSGDGVSDTPAQLDGSTNRPGKRHCWRLDPPINSCADNVTGVDPGNDAVNNYLDYGTGYCRHLYGSFTPMQIQRMIAQWETFRRVPGQALISAPTLAPSEAPSLSQQPTAVPTHSMLPSSQPSMQPSSFPSDAPSYTPSLHPTDSPSLAPSYAPTEKPTGEPSQLPLNESTVRRPVVSLSPESEAVRILARRCADRISRHCGSCADRQCHDSITASLCRKPSAEFMKQFAARLARMSVRICERSKS